MNDRAITGRHQVHGMGTGLEAPAWPPITEDEARAILAHFPAAGLLERLDWHSPRPFSAATLARASGGALLIKRHHQRLRSPDGLGEEHGFIAHLRAQGLPVADILATRSGATAISHAGWTYEVHRKAAGEDLYRNRQSWTPFLSPDHAAAAGAALARLHQAAAGYAAPARQQQSLVSSFTILPAADPLTAAEAYITARPALAGFLSGRPWRRDLARLFRTFGEGLPAALSNLPSSWTHNDWHASNLLWDDDRVAAILDFGLADRTTALHDLAIAIERNVIEWLRLGRGDDAIADIANARALIEGYAAVLPLPIDERALLARLLPLVHVEFALAEVDYFQGVLESPADAALAWDGYLIGHAEWFLSAPGRAFLADLGKAERH